MNNLSYKIKFLSSNWLGHNPFKVKVMGSNPIKNI